MTTIRHMLRFGTQYKVTTECGHSFTVAKSDLDRLQLFIGKRIACAQCGKGKA